MFKKILVANRGEIARRIARTCRSLGIAVATVHSQADAGALHVRDIGESVLIGGPAARDSYLDIDSVVRAAVRLGADAVHPGYGFLSENADFAQALSDQGIAFIGPTPGALRQFGDKAAAKALAASIGLPLIPGSARASDDPAEVAAMVTAIGLPVVLKAAAGGGGKGMRVVHRLDCLDDDIAGAMREGQSAFGDARLLVERYLPEGRHVEVQILGDGQGQVIHLWERECSLQRRFQKVVEEAPALALPAGLRQRLLDAALALGREVRYRALGTVEFLVCGQDFYFLEVNPRLQVEHPVTECITQLDLVALQIQAAAGLPLALAQADVTCNGHAIEVRVYAEDPGQNFMPATGRLHHVFFPDHLARVESGVDSGSIVTPHYDPMLAKLVVHAADRGQAIARIREAVAQTCIAGLANNLGLLQLLFDAPEVVAHIPTTATIDVLLASASPPAPVWQRPGGAPPLAGTGAQADASVAALAAAWVFDGTRTALAQATEVPVASWRGLTHWRLGATSGYAPSFAQYDVQTGLVQVQATVSELPGEPRHYRVQTGASRHCIDLRAAVEGQASPVTLDGVACRLWLGAENGQFWVSDGRQTATALVLPMLRHDRPPGAQLRTALTAPLAGKVLEVRVSDGDAVDAGQLLLVLESMKMELRITAPQAGVVQGLSVKVGASVERGAVLAQVEATGVKA